MYAVMRWNEYMLYITFLRRAEIILDKYIILSSVFQTPRIFLLKMSQVYIVQAT